MTQRPLVLAGLAALAVSAVLGPVRLGWFGGEGATTPDEMVPWLWAVALLCVVGLSIGRHPGRAWLATIGALSIATVDLATLARTVRAVVGQDEWMALAVGVTLTAALASTSAVAYATVGSRRLGRPASIAGSVAIVVVVVSCLWALSTQTPVAVALEQGETLGSLSLVTRTFLATVLAFVGFGLIGDARPVARAARRRVSIAQTAPTSVPERVAWSIAWLRAFVAEAAPGRTRAHRAALDERSRIARELHAEVVPAVRRALSEAERNGSVERLAESLRQILREVDGLVQSNHAIQLDVAGLVPAIEWLAERVEERSDVRVAITVVDSQHSAEQPPEDVAAAAFRVASLALENVVRHAPGAQVHVELGAASDRVTMAIADDGPGIPLARGRVTARAGGRGLIDMASEASACGGSLDIASAGDGTGTTVRFVWPRE